MAVDKNLEIAQQIQQKFEFFQVGLIFGVIALSVQTADLNCPALCSIGEILAWLTLLIAGLFGMSRLEWTPSVYGLVAQRNRLENNINHFKELKLKNHSQVNVLETGEIKSLDSQIKEYEANQVTVKKRLSKLRKSVSMKHYATRWLMIAGFLLLFMSRGYGLLSSSSEEISALLKPAAAAQETENGEKVPNK